MNKNFLFAALAAMTLSLGLVSCGDDDDQPTQTQQQPEDQPQDGGGSTIFYTSTFSTWGKVQFGYVEESMLDGGQKLTMTQDSIFFHSDTWGDAKFGQSANNGKIAVPRNGRTLEYDCTFETITDKNAYRITIPDLMNGTVININVAKKKVCTIVGSYSGGIYADFSYSQKYLPEAGQVMTIEGNDNETVNVYFVNPTWGTFTFSAVSITWQEDGSYALSGAGKAIMPVRQQGTSEVTDTREYAADITGTVANGKLVANISIPAVMSGTTIKFNPADFDEALNAASN